MFELSHLNEYETTPKDKRNATLVLKTWGIGVQSQRALGYFDRDKGEMVETQSFYLVEEASYDTNGSPLDLSSSNTTLTGLNPMAAFTRVDGVNFIGVNPHGSAKYQPAYVRAASGAPATGTIKAHDVTASSGAEVSSTTDLSATTFFVEVFGT